MEHKNEFTPINLISLLNRFFKAMKSLWMLTLILAVVLGGLMFIRARRSFVPYYESRALFTVTSGYGSGSIFDSTSYYDSATAQNLADSFPHLLNTDMMQDLVKTKLSAGHINGTVSAECIAGTNLFQLTVRSVSAQDAYAILLAVMDSYPQVAVYMVDDPRLVIQEAPQLPTEPVNTFSGTGAVLKGVALGLCLGIAVALVKALLTRTVLSAGELNRLVNLPLLVSVPHVVLKKRRATTRAFITFQDDRRLAEAFRGLRTKVRKLLQERGGKIVLLTSTVPGEGKSTISANLALSLAAEGHRVVLLDADLRNQTVFRMFGSGKASGSVMELMKNRKLRVADFLTPVEGTSLYYVSGISTRKRHYSIDGAAIRQVLEELSQRFDYIIVDSPPCGVVSDTALLCRYADCVLYVVRQEHAGENQILDALESLHQRDIPLSGCILNDVPRTLSDTRYGYGYGKKSKYGKTRE